MGDPPSSDNPEPANPALSSSIELVVRAHRTGEGVRVGAECASGG